MENVEIEHFHHAQGIKPSVMMATPSETLRVVLGRLGPIEDGIFVFIGECEESLKEPIEVEDGIDAHEPVDIDLTIDVLEIHRHRHVHRHHCRHVAVDVSFVGRDKRHKFSPATTIGVVTQWARKKFKLDPDAAAEFVLQIAGTQTQPRSDEHLGELVAKTMCSISFELVKEETPQG